MNAWDIKYVLSVASLLTDPPEPRFLLPDTAHKYFLRLLQDPPSGNAPYVHFYQNQLHIGREFYVTIEDKEDGTRRFALTRITLADMPGLSPAHRVFGTLYEVMREICGFLCKQHYTELMATYDAVNLYEER